MEIILSDVMGFCFGVRRAIELAEQALSEGRAVSTLGSLVHNDQETARLQRAGIRQVETPEAVDTDTVVIRAHGARPEVFEALRQRQVRIVDATCPFVGKSQRLAREASDRRQAVIIIGHHDHPEVQGILGYVDGPAYVIASPDEVATLPDGLAPIVIAQTTMTKPDVRAVVAVLEARYPDLQLFDTVCSATRKHQEAARRLAVSVDVVYVIGGRQSSNTNRLAEICRQACPRTYLIETADEITPADLAGVSRVGITAGASTPAWLIDDVIARLRHMQS